jgi:hypothetical protein
MQSHKPGAQWILRRKSHVIRDVMQRLCLSFLLLLRLPCINSNLIHTSLPLIHHHGNEHSRYTHPFKRRHSPTQHTTQHTHHEEHIKQPQQGLTSGFVLFFTRVSFSFHLNQSNTLRPYLNAVRQTLTAAMCLENFSSQVAERHNKPEVEVGYASSDFDWTMTRSTITFLNTYFWTCGYVNCRAHQFLIQDQIEIEPSPFSYTFAITN